MAYFARTGAGISGGLFKRSVKLAIAGADVKNKNIDDAIGYTEGYDPLLGKKIADKLGFTHEINSISKLAISAGGKIKAAAGGKVEDDGTPDGIAKQLIARWVELQDAAVDIINQFQVEYGKLIDSGSTIDEAYKSAYELALATTKIKMRRINNDYPVNVQQDLERRLHNNLSSKIRGTN